MSTLYVKKGDTVVVLSGKEKGKKGKIMTSIPSKEMVVIEGVNFIMRHTKPRKMGDQGGILRSEGPIRACKVMLVCPKCHQPTRPKHVILADGTKNRACKKCGDTI